MHLWCVEIVWAFWACEDKVCDNESVNLVCLLCVVHPHFCPTSPKLTLGATYWQTRELQLNFLVMRWAQWSRQCNFVMAQLWILIIRVPKQRSAKNTVENPGPAVTDSACIFYRVLNFISYEEAKNDFINNNNWKKISYRFRLISTGYNHMDLAGSWSVSTDLILHSFALKFLK